MRQNITDATEAKVNICLGTACHGSKLIRGKLFPDRYLHPISACCVCCCQSSWLSRQNQCENLKLSLEFSGKNLSGAAE